MEEKDGGSGPYQRWIKPTEVDLRLPEEDLRQVCREALLGSLTPMLALRHHGAEGILSELAVRASDHCGSAQQQVGQKSYSLEGEDLSPLVARARGALKEVTEKMLRVLAGDGAVVALAEGGEAMVGRLCLRVYPERRGLEAHRLGAHCDGTLMTLLWSDAPGLQVVNPACLEDWTPEQVTSFGLPSMGPPPPELRSEQWATVDLPWGEGALLFTLGTGWQRCPIAMASLPAASAALHRVVVPAGMARDRHSLPFLVDVVPLPGGEEKRAS